MGAGGAKPGPEEQCMLEHGKGGRYDGFMGEVAFELNLERGIGVLQAKGTTCTKDSKQSGISWILYVAECGWH